VKFDTTKKTVAQLAIALAEVAKAPDEPELLDLADIVVTVEEAAAS
jgi:hypothetical protein